MMKEERGNFACLIRSLGFRRLRRCIIPCSEGRGEKEERSKGKTFLFNLGLWVLGG